MAKLIITADTESKECSVSVDGRVVPGIGGVYLSVGRGMDGDKYINLEVTQEIKDPSGLTKRIGLSLSSAGLEKVNVKANMSRLK